VEGRGEGGTGQDREESSALTCKVVSVTLRWYRRGICVYCSYSVENESLRQDPQERNALVSSSEREISSLHFLLLEMDLLDHIPRNSLCDALKNISMLDILVTVQ
jgi:hypothetical protein